MIKQSTSGVAIKNYQCVSADVADLPTDGTVAEGATCLVVDTGDIKIFHDGQWYDL